MRRPTSYLGSLFCLGLLASLDFAQDASRLIVLPGGIADTTGRTGILANAAGGLDVVDLATGDILWKTAEARRPILVVGERLYAEAAAGRNGLRLLAFDLPTNGSRIFESEAVVFPEWAHMDGARGRSFTTHWHRERNRLILSWEATTSNERSTALFRLTGKATSKTKVNPEILTGQIESLDAPSEKRRAAGRAAFDLETGKVEILPDQAETLALPAQAPNEAGRYVLRWQREIGGNFTVVCLDSDKGQQALVLRSWDRVTGKQMPPKELFRGNRPIIVPTLDDRFLCLRDAQPSPDKGMAQFSWSVVAPETGELVARLPFQAGTQAVTLVGSRAYFLADAPLRGPIDRPFVRPQMLKAIDARTGKLLWERPVSGKRTRPAGT